MPREFTFEINSSRNNETHIIKLGVVDFTAHEYMSAPFTVNLQLASEPNESEIDFDEVIEQPAHLTIETTASNSAIRYFHGIIREFVKLGRIHDQYIYRAVMVPDLWKLSLITNSRIFQNLEVTNKPLNRISDGEPIVNTILSEAGIDFEIIAKATYEPRDYCAQYQETNLNFISRLLEEEGIFYFFKHFEDTETKNIKHKLFIGDSYLNYTKTGRYIRFSRTGQNSAMSSGSDFIYDFTLSRSIYSGKVTLKDFDFIKPATPVEKVSLWSGLKDSGGINFSKLETYEYPGGYTYSPDTKSDREIKQRLADVRLQEEAVRREMAYGKSVCHDIMPGHIFTLGNAPFTLNKTGNDNNGTTDEQEYVPIEIIHRGTQPNKIMGDSHNTSATYYNEFYAVPSSVTFRPQRKTPRNVIRGPQTAVVVDANGDVPDKIENPQDDKNVYTDQYGRVKVRFHWERSHKKNKKDKWYNTAWVRVSQAWAGQGWGSMHIPHVGQEVIVDFLDSDPDRPIITGRVYNGENMPYDNGANDTMNPYYDSHISGFRDEYGNKLIFDSKAGEEKVVLKSPNHDSYLRLGEDGAELKTRKDVGWRVAGNIFEAGCGTKFEAIAGLDIVGKIAQSYDFTFGQVLELFMGNKIAVQYGTVRERTKTKDMKEVDGDIKHECKRDYKLTAGDGLSILAGVNDLSNNTSILSAFADGVIFSFGDKAETKDATIDRRAHAAKYNFWVFSIAGLFSALLAKAFDAAGEGTDVSAFRFTNYMVTILTSAIALLQGLIAVVIGASEKDSVEPSYHRDPSAVFGINEGGITLAIKPDLEKAKEDLAKIHWAILRKKVLKSTTGKDLDALQDDEREIWKKFIKNSLGEQTVAKSKMVMKEDGSIKINSNGSKEKEKIELSVGDPKNQDNIFLMDQDGIAIGDGKSKSMITILKDDEITISTSGKNITLAPGTGTVDIQGQKVKVLGSDFTKQQVNINGNLTILAS